MGVPQIHGLRPWRLLYVVCHDNLVLGCFFLYTGSQFSVGFVFHFLFFEVSLLVNFVHCNYVSCNGMKLPLSKCFVIILLF